MVTTRTIGPLHLEDLDPHRFEDLVRQLLYDFRPWRTLEATGRSGADDGFDVRAIESITRRLSDEDGEDDDDTDITFSERTWLVQCKREKAIGPQKLIGYLADIAKNAQLYGIIFAAACDFSKTSRDRFRERARELGFEEAHLWGKGEIEDQLFQPKNDYLLFAYFGVSLQTRRRTLKTEVRAKLATKRKAHRWLNGKELRPILLRDATDDRYPWMDEDEKKNPIDRRRWQVMVYQGTSHDGLYFILHRHPAYVGDDGQEWDFAEKFDSGPAQRRENPWWTGTNNPEENRSETFNIWDALPEINKFWFVVYAILPFDNILDIDENGDDCFDEPHIYTTEFRSKRDPFSGFREVLERNTGFHRSSMIDRMMSHMRDKLVIPDMGKRIRKFPRRGG